ncbi:MAG: hypothetical protein CMH83_09660 [Nocardioides sp.]|nr:hypothetical protein [Nocardioides sp.]
MSTRPTAGRAAAPGVDAEGAARVAARYGRTPAWRRWTLLGVVGVAVVVAGAWVGWTAWEQSRPLVSSAEPTYVAFTDNAAEVEFAVRLREPDVEATCQLRAYAEDHVLVGQLSFVPEIDDAGFVTVSVATDRRATAVEVVGCTAPGQPRPR